MTNQQLTFVVYPRTVMGKQVKQLRKAGRVPANVYGLKKDSESLELDAAVVQKQLAQHPDANLVYLQFADATTKPTPALLDVVEVHPLTGELQHIAFRRVSLTEKIAREVPIELVGEVDVPDATLVQVLDAVEVEALPADIPERFEVDVAQLAAVGDSITLSQLSFDTTKVTLMATEEELSQPVVLLQEVKEEVEEEPVDVEAGAGEAGEGQAEDSATGAAETTDAAGRQKEESSQTE